ncbi:MAG: response regulator [Gemmatimonadetes bacterium]|nr:response regulator [Gemmatimonadota bacterium]MBT4608808.1 response regulator [Gemmatimonadota bacterium]MBT5060148.1 response regulator [Gemmatimonadota bacterium]MBT5142711.1 response regulator [Gemmatimonadota bacterium]MBT5587687.1 response regulator [Gemmatimonadota bacterium]
MFSTFLDKCGHHVLAAGDGEEALVLLEENPNVQVVISDIRMPKMDGLELLRITSERFPHISVILITGHGDPEIITSARKLGAVECFVKPVRLTRIREYLDELETESTS